MTIAHDIKKLPVWAQKMISDMELKIAALTGLKQAHAVLEDHDREWFVVQNPDEKPFVLWRFYEDRPAAICSLSKNDAMLVGRSIGRRQVADG